MRSLVDFARGILEAVGVPSGHALMASRAVVAADVRGIPSHGLARLPVYVARLERRLIDPRPCIRVVREWGATCLLDAGNGLGHVAAIVGIKSAITLALRYGVGLVGVRNSNHFGMAAHYTMMAAERGLIGLALSNTAPAMAPLGGAVPMLGTNPVSVAVPAGSEGMVVLDMSTSSVARGRVRMAALAGQRIPLDWGLDREGRPTDDPWAVLEGSLLPAAGAKGYALALIVDILSGVLTGSAYGPAVRESTDFAGPARVGHLLGALKVDAFANARDFVGAMECYARSLKACPRAAGVDRVFLPGEMEAERAAVSERLGVPLSAEVWENLATLGARYGVPFPRLMPQDLRGGKA